MSVISVEPSRTAPRRPQFARFIASGGCEREMDMPKTTLLVSACVLGLSLTQALAMDAKCDDASMASMKTEISGMKDAKMQKSAMMDMDKAEMAMKKHQMKTCASYMSKAMKAMGTTGSM
jgi:hypothetical protein